MYTASMNVDVTLFGVSFNGSDITTGLQKCIDLCHKLGGGIVEMPHGLGLYSSPIFVYNDTELVGKGRNSTFLKAKSTNTNLNGGAAIKSYTDSDDGIKLRKFRVIGNGQAKTTGIGINLPGGVHTFCTFEDLVVDNFPEHGLYAKDILASDFTRCYFERNGLDGVFVELGTSFSFKQCYSTTNGRAGFHTKSSTYITFDATASEYNPNQYWLENSRNVTMNSPGCEVVGIGNSAKSPVCAGYRLTGCTCVVMNAPYSSSFLGLNSLPGYHFYIKDSDRIELKFPRGKADEGTPGVETHYAPTGTIYIDNSKVFVYADEFTGLVGGGMSGTPKIHIDEDGVDLLA
jgi:hypothetical protein